MRYSFELFKIGNDPTLTLDEKRERILEVLQECMYNVEDEVKHIERMIKRIVEEMI